MTLKKWFIALVIGLMTWVAQAATLEEQSQLMAANVHNYIINYYYQQGEFEQALPWAEKVLKIKTELLGEKNVDTLVSMANLAEIYRELGRLSEALHLAENSYLLRKEVLGDKHIHTIHSLNTLALVYYNLGSLDEALPLLEENYRFLKEVLGEKRRETITVMINLGVIYQYLDRPTEGLPLLEQGYRLSEEVFGKKHYLTLYAMNNLGSIYEQLGQLEEALQLFEKGYPLTEQVLGKKHPLTLKSLNNLAEIYRALGHLEDEVLSLSKKAYYLHKEVLGEKHPNTLTILGNVAFAYARQDNFKKAIELLEQLVESVEQLQTGDLSVENRQTFFKKRVEYYTILSALYITQSRTLDAFRLAEMTKARTLLESMAAKLAAQQSGLTKTEQQQLRDFESRLTSLNNRIAKALANNRLAQKIRLENDKKQLLNQFNEFHQALIAKYPKYAKLSAVSIVGAKEGAKYLPTDAVLISYIIAEYKDNKNNIFAFTLQANGTLTAHHLGVIPNLKQKVENYRRRLLVVSRGRVALSWKKETQALLSSELGKQLLEPLYQVIKDKPHWIISPSGPLALIPFETLRLEGEEQQVIAKHNITYVQSLSVLKLLQERDKAYQSIKNRETLLAMGAPIYHGDIGTSNTMTTKPNVAHHIVQRGGDYGRALTQLDLKWRTLPGALKELEILEQLFIESKPRIYKQAQATETQLQTLNQQGWLAQHRYLVFAAHGYLSTEVPALSSIVLGQVNNPPGIDGYVTASEWPGYDLKSDLMVLSACETGVGEVVSGEGVMGLPYAFYVAGNKNTILTLWPISDEVTVEFIAGFFAKLKAGIGQIEALAATKREFINKGGRYSDPSYWAAFVLYGV